MSVSKELVVQLLNLLKGSSGHIHLKDGFTYGDYTITGPATFDFEIINNELKLKFLKPYPQGRTKIFRKNILSVSVTLSEITIEIDWAPDVRIKVL